MEIQHLTTKFVYRIEPKPEGGFVARATDPALPVFEAQTREELQEKIRAKIAESLGEGLSSLKLPLIGSNTRVDVNKKSGLTLSTNLKNMRLAFTASVQTSPAAKVDEVTAAGLRLGVGETTSPSVNAGMADTAITPEATSWKRFWILVTLVFLAALVYYFLHR